MYLAQQLTHIVDQHHSLADIMNAAVQVIAKQLSVEACSIFLLDPRDQRLHLLATQGLSPSALGKVSLAVGEGLVGQVMASMRPLALEHAASDPGYRYFPETGEEQFLSFLGVPMAIRGRPVGVLIVQTATRRAYSESDIQALCVVSAQLVGIVANARLIEALDRGERAPQVLLPRPAPAAARRDPPADLVLPGHAASPGIAIGVAVLRGLGDARITTRDWPFRGADEEKGRLRDALEKARNDVLRIQRAAAQETDEEHALIFSSHLLLLNDAVLLGRIDQAIAAGKSAPVAVDTVLTALSDQLQGVPDPYLQERVEDIHDLRARVLGHLLGWEERGGIAQRIVVTRRIPPSLIVEIKAEGALGIVTETGGTTSHGVLLARSMGVAMVSGVADLASLVRGGDQLIVDGTRGTVTVNPSAETLARAERAACRVAELRTEHRKYHDRPGLSADDVPVQLQANVNVTADLGRARDSGAEGVGLYRTEYPFILREEFPTREEQVLIYRRAYEVFPEGPINFRILDLGGDKFVPGGPIAGARSPFHGYRSIRVLFDYPHVLRSQVQAFALAAGRRPLRILIPMVSSLDELRRVRGLIDEAIAALQGGEVQRAPTIGVMIEVPAAVEIAADLAAESDFLSIGTNDLIQYSLVADREDSRLNSASDFYHPAILRMIRRTITAGHGAGRRVSVCGEMAGRKELATLLLAMGIDGLSVVPGVIPEIKQALAATEIGPLAARVDRLLALSDAESVRAELRSYLPTRPDE